MFQQFNTIWWWLCGLYVHVVQVKSDTQWMMEYRKLELKTRMQLQTKDKEIKRLRKVIRQLQKENSDNLDQLFSEMKSQVENVAMWVDFRSKAVPHSSSLVKIALSQDGKNGDLYGSHESQLSSSDISSTQSTLERRHHQRKESLESYYPNSTYTQSSCNSSVATPTEGNINLGGYPDLMVQLFTKNASNPSTAIESDTSYVNRPLQATQSTLTLVSQSDSGDSDLPLAVPRNTTDEESGQKLNERSSTLTTTFIQAHGLNMNTSSAAHTETGTEPLPLSLPTDANSTHAAVGLPTTADEPHTPSTVKSNVSSPKSSLHGSPTQRKFKYGKEITEQESMADLKAVFKRIQGKDILKSYS